MRFLQRLKRSFVIAKRQQLTQDDVNALRENQQRVSLIISARWLMIVLFALFSIAGAAVFWAEASIAELLGSIIFPLNALVLVIVYNFVFTKLNSMLSNISVASMLQLVFDVIVVTVLVYFSGGVESWFWVVYLLILFAAALISQNASKIWALALFICAMLMAVQWGAFFGLIPYQHLPFATGVEWYSAQFVLMRSLWQVSMILGTALIASNGVNWLLNLVSYSRESQLIDVRTGLYSRAFLLRTQEIEAHRALRDGRSLHLMLIDIDDFAAINSRFGFEKGDTVIKQLSAQLQSELLAFDNDYPYSSNIAARISGEEFALLLSENSSESHLRSENLNVGLSVEDVAGFAQHLCSTIAETEYDGVSITVSIGLASLPLDTLDPDELGDRADEALARAVSQGGGCVAVPAVRDLEVAFNAELS
ncbi:MAG: GGDEF domain-containing protein [Coriobacteriia bacterium]|nr:GGDEF domain-containing protein [Coriobacteriia bacterium]